MIEYDDHGQLDLKWHAIQTLDHFLPHIIDKDGHGISNGIQHKFEAISPALRYLHSYT